MIVILVKDLKEGQRFWHQACDVGKASPERIMQNGRMIWADGTTNIHISHMEPDETVYAKSIINTGDNMSLQDELKQANDRVDAHIKCKKAHDVCIADGMAEMAKVKQQIADAEKPKPEHLDYGFFPKFNAIGVYLDFGEFKDVVSYSSKVNNCDHATGVVENGLHEGFVKYGNYNDLKAMQENVTEFRTGGNKAVATFKVTWDEDGDLELNFAEADNLFVAKADVSSFILKLRQMEATLKRKKVSE